MQTAAHTNSVIPETGFLRLPQVLQLIPVSKSAWWLGIKELRYPQGIKLGPNTTAWKVEDIRDLIEQLGEQKKERSGHE